MYAKFSSPIRRKQLYSEWLNALEIEDHIIPTKRA
jgi:hypothetical protein